MEAPRAPTAWRLLGESRALLELPRLVGSLPGLLARPRGEGRAVRVLPGFGAGDASTAVLRTYLGRIGHRAAGWGLGTNDGDVPALIPRVVELARRAADEAGHPVRLVGWSLGGVLAREAAREAPEAVARVVTLGSPVVGGPKYTAAGAWYARQGYDLDAIEAEVEARNAVPIRVPVTAVYSRSDAVVAWQACIDRVSPDVEHVEVRSTHLGLGLSAEVFGIVADRLAVPDPI
jgi:pimeloyl-ACP methyl ester carboxylesterase